MMRKLLALLFFLLPIPLLAQFTNTTATVPVLQTASYTWDFVNLSGHGPPLLGGISQFPTQLVGSFDGAGHMAALLADNNQVLPLPSQWRISVVMCKGDPSGPIGFNFQTTITGASQDISVALAAALPPIPANCNGGGGGGGGGGSTPPAPPSFAVQFANLGHTAFQADPTTVFGGGSAFSYTPSTNTLNVNALNGLSFVAPKQTGAGGNGVQNFFGSTPNLFGIIDSNEIQSATEPVFPAPNNSTVFDTRTNWSPGAGAGQMAFGFRFNNCAASTQLVGPYGQPFSPCAMYYSNDTLPAVALGRGALFLASDCSGPGIDMGNPSGYYGQDQLWTLCGNFGLGAKFRRIGISNGQAVWYEKDSAGDLNALRFTILCGGGAFAGSDEGCKGIVLSISENTQATATIASTTGTGDTNPTYTITGGFSFFPGGSMVDTSVSVTGAATGQSVHFSGSGIISLNHLTDGASQPPSPIDTVTSITTSSGGTAVLNGTFSTCATNACAGLTVGYNTNFNNQLNNPINALAPGAFLITASTTTTLTIANPYAVAETKTITVNINASVSCTGGSGLIAGAFVSSDGKTHLNATVVDGGTGYSDSSVCTVAGGSPGGTQAASVDTNLQVMPVTITGGTMRTIAGVAMTNTYIPSNPNNPQVNQSYANISVTNQNGTALTSTGCGASGCPAWIIDDTTQEMVNITAATAIVSGHQTITVSSHLAHTFQAYIYQTPAGAGLGDGSLSFDNNVAFGRPNSNFFVIGAPDSTHLYVAWPIAGSLSTAAIPGAGYQMASLTFPNFHIFGSAPILYTDTTGLIPVLGVNTVPWANGHAVAGRNHPSFIGAIESGGINIDTPVPAAGDGAFQWQISGQHMSGGYSMYLLSNSNPYGWYQGCDTTSVNVFAAGFCKPVTGTAGSLTGPTIFNFLGPYGFYTKLFPPLPQGAIINVNDALQVYPNYTIVATQRAGNFQVDDTNAQFNIDTSLRVAANVAASTFHTMPSHGTTGEVYSQNNSGVLIFSLNDSVDFNSTASLSAGAYYGALFYAGAQAPIANQVFYCTTPGPSCSGTGPGSTSYSYSATCVTSVGETTASSTITLTSGAASLTSSAYNYAKFFANNGCQSLNIYRGTNGGGLAVGLIVQNAPLNLQGGNDTGQGIIGGITHPPTADTSGQIQQNVVNGCAQWASGILTTTGSACGSGGGSGVTSINGTAGAFTFTGSAVSCTSTTCTFGPGTAAWSALTNPTTTLALSMGNANTTVWTVGAATSTNNMFTFQDTASNTGTGILVLFNTASGSAMTPWEATANGVGWKVDTSGNFTSVGASASGAIKLGGSTSGTATLTVLAIAGTPTLTLPTVTDTIAGFLNVAPAFVALTDGATVTWATASQPGANATLLFTTHGGSRTLNVTGLVDGASYVLTLTQDGTGGEGLTLGTGCTWKVGNGGSGAISPSTGANAVDVLAFVYRASNTTCYVNFNKNFN